MSTLRENLNKLLQLQRVDSERDKLIRQRPTLESINKIVAAGAAAQADFQAKRTALSLTNGSLKDAELELAGIEKKIKDYESKMRQGLVTNTREVMNFEKEFNQLNRQRSVLDDRILSLMEESESKSTAVSDAESKAAGIDQQLKTAKSAFHTELARVDASIGRLNAEREAHAKLVDDPALLKRYETLRARPGLGGIAITHADGNSCGGCHMQIGTVAVTQAELGVDLAICENCGRILA